MSPSGGSSGPTSERTRESSHSSRQLPKAPTGIAGLDQVTEGGLPRGRATLVCGPAGCGKTLMAMEFVARGITMYDEPGVFLAFEADRGPRGERGLAGLRS